MEQFQAHVPPLIRNAIEIQADILLKDRLLADKCSHNACHDPIERLKQFGRIDQVPHEHVTVTIGGQSYAIPFGMIHCN
jgi:hypothetical protein